LRDNSIYNKAYISSFVRAVQSKQAKHTTVSIVNKMSGRRNERNGSSLRREMTMLKHRMNGVAVRPSGDPGQVQQQPWTPLTVIMSASGALTNTALVGSLRGQLGLAATDPVLIKLQEVRAWGAPGGSLQLVVFDPTTQRVLYTGQDIGSGTNRARLGYIYPARVQTESYNPSDSTLGPMEFASTVLSPSGAGTSGAFFTNLTIHVRLMYRMA